MNRYRAVIFDLGMTLIYPPMVNSFYSRLEEFGCKLDKLEIRKGLVFVDAHFMINYPGVLNKQVKDFYTSYASMMFAYLHIEHISVKEFTQAMLEKSPPRSEWKVFPDAERCLQGLKDKGCKIGLCTNWDLGARDLVRSLELYPYFDSIVVSSEIGEEKPGAKGFLQSIENLIVEPQEALYVGDNHHDDVLGANGVGIKALLLERDGHRQYRKGNFDRITSLEEVLEYSCNDV